MYCLLQCLAKIGVRWRSLRYWNRYLSDQISSCTCRGLFLLKSAGWLWSCIPSKPHTTNCANWCKQRHAHRFHKRTQAKYTHMNWFSISNTHISSKVYIWIKPMIRFNSYSYHLYSDSIHLNPSAPLLNWTQFSFIVHLIKFARFCFKWRIGINSILWIHL